jgi:O-antigen/teichoic acid export membrane protein
MIKSNKDNTMPFSIIIKGLLWMSSFRGMTRIIALIKIILLARLLTPLQFGTFGVVSIVMAFLEVFTDTGINTFLIQKKDSIEKYLNTSWIISILRGFFIGLIMAVLSEIIASFFKSEESKYLIIIFATIPVVRGFINPLIVSLQKELYFRKEFILRSILFFVDTVISVYCVYRTGSLLGLYWGMLVSVLLELIISFIYFKPLPKFSLNMMDLRHILKRGKWMTASGIFNYLFHQGDDIVVGRLLDTYYLGLYQTAYKMATLPIMEVGEVFNKVTFPIYVKIRYDRTKLLKYFFKVTLIISLLVTPFTFILFLYPSQIVEFVLGKSWLPVANAVKILALFSFVRAITGSCASLFMAVEKQEYITTFTLASILGMFITILPLVQKYNIVGASISSLIGSITATPFILYYIYKIFKKL